MLRISSSSAVRSGAPPRCARITIGRFDVSPTCLPRRLIGVIITVVDSSRPGERVLNRVLDRSAPCVRRCACGATTIIPKN